MGNQAKNAMAAAVATRGHQPAAWARFLSPAAALGDSVPPLAVVPLGRVPLMRMVSVPLTSPMETRLLLREL